MWQTVNDVALVGAAVGKGSIRIHGVPEGSFDVKDTIVQEFDKQTISDISMKNNQLVMKGMLSGKTGSVAYNFTFKQFSSDQLRYVLNVSGNGAKNINRLF